MANFDSGEGANPLGEVSPARGVPLLVTAELPADILEWSDSLRRAHYPPERNRLQAHVTLFHGLPPSARAEVHDLLIATAGEAKSPEACISGVMDLGRGTALAIDSCGMIELHERLAESLHGLIQQKDARELRLHITVQNKVERSQAKALQAELAATFRSQGFRFRGFGFYGWDGILWNFERLYSFRR
ncbi:MAG: 2'-5' RNA ligase family protein [Novosphingobium sp.]|nr:2'-5' RNA ligase family protein [Novosphingobium sp.]